MKKFPLTVYKLTKGLSVMTCEMVQSSGVCVRHDRHASGGCHVSETITNLLPTIIPSCMNSINIPNDMKKIVCMHYSRWRGMCHQSDSRASVPSRNCVVSFAAKTRFIFCFVLSVSALQCERTRRSLIEAMECLVLSIGCTS